MNKKRNNNIPSTTADDILLSSAVDMAFNMIKNDFLCKIPNNWNFELSEKSIRFDDIKTLMIEEGISYEKAESYYGGPSSIVSDCPIIHLVIIKNKKTIKKPLFIGEIKKQGTNDERIARGLKKQAVGNAGTDRVAKNLKIASDYCFLCDKEFFPYNVFLHGCDFDEIEISSTTKAKLHPFFGKLNCLNSFFNPSSSWVISGYNSV